ncbi:MAG TPA: XRE family transcriptional regulator [Actinomycetes bacterium]
MSVVDLGASLRAERLRQGLSLRETARRLGISASALSQIETGKAHPSVGKLFDIVNLLNVSVDGLLAGQAVVTRNGHGFTSLQRAGEHETLELESGVRWRRLTIHVGFDVHELGPGDSISFPATTPHRLGNHGSEPAVAVWCILGRDTPFSDT